MLCLEGQEDSLDAIRIDVFQVHLVAVQLRHLILVYGHLLVVVQVAQLPLVILIVH